PIETGIKIIEGMRGHTSGLGVPTFVVDVPGGGGKIPLQPNYVLSWTENEMILRNYEGLIFRYRNPRPESPRGKSQSAKKAQVSTSNGHSGKVLVEAASTGTTPRLERRRTALTSQAQLRFGMSP
ncbi:MAG: hypothetical protein HY531_02980, partial [Chloroflexi bacterium]|nr:hypothetical protein [Chloroflexota bacterium]